ncbi:uncharacterized protein LOC117647858 [Thrips palmi]|uniref:Uncharacterized protein LOC117647858 n=1 Tax=Thrips palmi TaxID=161013 RepID=A0A6P8Z6U6_THRPL|nr:uncharacterized protein LOC117647858 [Thrips palmi]
MIPSTVSERKNCEDSENVLGFEMRLGNWRVRGNDDTSDHEADSINNSSYQNGNFQRDTHDSTDPTDSNTSKRCNSNLRGIRNVSNQQQKPRNGAGVNPKPTPRVSMVFSNDDIGADFFIEDEEPDDPETDLQEDIVTENPIPSPRSTTPAQETLSTASKRTRKDLPRDNTRKRVTHTVRWKRNICKGSFNSGSSYTNAKGKEKPARSIKPPCSEKCNRCERKLTNDERQNIFENFWALESIERKRDYITRLVDERVPATRSTSPECARKTVRSYHFVIDDREEVRVCKTMFINTLGLPDVWVETSLKKVGPNGLVPDQRGKHNNRPTKISEETIESVRTHINLFPRVASHYTRERTKREYLETNVHSIERMFKLYKEWAGENNVETPATISTYRNIFNTQFNLGFFLPKKDQCELCNKWKTATPEERKGIVQQYGVHLTNKRDVRKMHIRDVQRYKDGVQKLGGQADDTELQRYFQATRNHHGKTKA